MGIFDEKKDYARPKFNEVLKRVLGTKKGGELARRFGRECGGTIDPKDVKQTLEKLRLERNKLTGKEKGAAEQQLKDLEKTTGVKI